MCSLDHVWGSREKAGGNAFPGETKVLRQNQADGGKSKSAVKQMDPGMTLRDYFAAKALAAMIGQPDKDGANRGSGGVPMLCAFAYEYADAMIAERAK